MNGKKQKKPCFSNDIYKYVKEGWKKEMRKKGQINIGILIVAFVGIIVGLALFGSIASHVAGATNTRNYNTSAGDAAGTGPLDGESIDLDGQEYISDMLVYNASGGASADGTIGAANYTIDENVSTTTGLKTITYSADTTEFEGSLLNFTYVYGADGYIENAGGRAIAGIIVIFSALVIATVALVPALRSEVLGLVGR